MPIDLSTYQTLATSIADRAIHSRSGFGSFGKFDTLFERTHRLVARSSLHAPPHHSPNPMWGIDPDYIPFAMSHGHYNHAQFIRSLASPELYHPQCIWALFWALAKAEHEFAGRYLPFWSHEERLTGHFVSQVCERIWEFDGRWSDLAANDQKTSRLDVWYADTATGKREKETGADLGLIVNGQYAGEGEFYKAARFQVKKVPPSNTATIDLDQTEAMLRTENLGYYLFYHGQDSQDWRRPPSVAPAIAFERHVKDADESGEHGTRPRKELGSKTVNNVDSVSCDFAAFITFALADPGIEAGAVARSKSEAVHALMGGGAPSRLAVISLGKAIQPAEWLDEMGEYVRIPRGENE